MGLRKMLTISLMRLALFGVPVVARIAADIEICLANFELFLRLAHSSKPTALSRVSACRATLLTRLMIKDNQNVLYMNCHFERTLV